MFEIIVTTAFTRTHFIHFLKTAQTVDTSFMLSAAALLSSHESVRQSDGWGSEEFLTCVSHTAHVIAIGWASVRPFVLHTLVLCRNGSTYRQTASSLPGSPMILVFWGINFPGIPIGIGNIPTGALNARDRKKLQFLTNISLIARKRLKIDATKFWSLSKLWTYGLNYWETVEDRRVHAAMSSVWQALNPLSIHVTFTAIVPAGRTQGRSKCAETDARSVGDSHPSCILFNS